MKPDDLDSHPRLGWAQTPTPVDFFSELTAQLQCEWLGVKRDDLLEPLHGGSKTRKLDFLLSTPAFAQAQRWATVGAIGSGHLVACVAAAQKLGKQIHAQLFWEPLSVGVADSLAYTATHANSLGYNRTRLALAFNTPQILLGVAFRGAPSIPPGGTLPAAMLGLIRAGLELGVQVRNGELPEPQHIYLPFGSGGTAVGLALGLAAAGITAKIHGISAVERPFTLGRWRALDNSMRVYLRANGFAELAAVRSLPFSLRHDHVGPGYGHASTKSNLAVEILTEHGLELEPIYTGKAFAALIEDTAAAKFAGKPLRNVLFWNTLRRMTPLPCAPDWRQRLPRALQDDLSLGGNRQRSRRIFLLGGAGLAALGVASRFTGYTNPLDWRGEVLQGSHVTILLAAAAVVLASAPPLPKEATLAINVDRFLAQAPRQMQREAMAAIIGLEQGTITCGKFNRFSSLEPADRGAYLADLRDRGGVSTLMYSAIRDLCMVGYYQESATWSAIDYGGPLVDAQPRPRRQRYADLVAPVGALPQSLGIQK